MPRPHWLKGRSRGAADERLRGSVFRTKSGTVMTRLSAEKLQRFGRATTPGVFRNSETLSRQQHRVEGRAAVQRDAHPKMASEDYDRRLKKRLDCHLGATMWYRQESQQPKQSQQSGAAPPARQRQHHGAHPPPRLPRTVK
uniref:Uncharacterized protein n=1 Tax=Macrostomum lignano TaxID=282301 RepID=A0A1I8JPT8_9PLAT